MPIDWKLFFISFLQNSAGGVYEWNEFIQGWILSSFYIGYVLTHVPGGVLAERFGGKYTLGLGILSTAIFTLLTPLAVESGGAYALIALRILMGLGEGTTFPALSVLLASWVPVNERSKVGSFVFGGGQVSFIFSIDSFVLRSVEFFSCQLNYFLSFADRLVQFSEHLSPVIFCIRIRGHTSSTSSALFRSFGFWLS